MHSLFHTLQKYALLRAAIYVILGVLLLLFPDMVIHVIVYILAGYLALLGLIHIFSFLRSRTSSSYFESRFISGILLVALAIVLAVFSRPILSILPLFLGLLIVAAGAVQLAQGFDLHKLGYSQLSPFFIYGSLLLIAGIVIIFFPFGSLTLLFRVVGVILVVMGVGECYSHFVFQKAKRDA